MHIGIYRTSYLYLKYVNLNRVSGRKSFVRQALKLTCVDTTCDSHVWISCSWCCWVTCFAGSEFSLPEPSKSSVPSTLCTTVTDSNVSWLASHGTCCTVAHQTKKTIDVSIKRWTIRPMARLTSAINITDTYWCTPISI